VYSDGDLNYDGTVSISDFIDLASKFGASLGPVPAVVPPQPAAGDGIVESSSMPEVTAVLEAPPRNHRKSHGKRHEALPPRRQQRHHRGRPLLRLLARHSDNS